MSNFETPQSLTNEEIHELRKESTNKELSEPMQTRLKDNDKYKLFLQEYKDYLDRSTNETSRKVIDGLFRNILGKVGIKLDTMEQAQAYAADQIDSPTDEVIVPTDQDNANAKLNSISEYYSSGDGCTPAFPQVPETNNELSLSEDINLPDIMSDAIESIKSEGLKMVGELREKSYSDRQQIQDGLGIEKGQIDGIFAATQSGLFEDISSGIGEIYAGLTNKPPVITPENVNFPETKEQFTAFCKEVMAKVMQLIEDSLISQLAIYKNDDSENSGIIYKTLLGMKSSFDELRKEEIFVGIDGEKNLGNEELNESLGKAYDQMVSYYSYIKGHLAEIAGERVSDFNRISGYSLESPSFESTEPYKEKMDDIFDSVKNICEQEGNDKMFTANSSLPFNRKKERVTKKYDNTITYSFSRQKISNTDNTEIVGERPSEKQCNYIIERVDNEKGIREMLVIDSNGKFSKLVTQNTESGEKEYFTGQYYESLPFDPHSGYLSTDPRITEARIATMNDEINSFNLTDLNNLVV